MQLICEDFQVPLGVLGIIFEARPDAAVQVTPTRWHSLPNVATGNDEHAFLESRYSEPRDDRNSEPNPAARPGTIEPFCRRCRGTVRGRRSRRWGSSRATESSSSEQQGAV